MTKNIFVADIGTTSLKACVYDSNLKLIDSFTKKYELLKLGEFIEFVADDYYKIFLNVYNKLSKDLQIDAICISTQGETLIVADEDGKPLYNAICWLDNRAGEQAKEIENYFGAKKVYETTGQPEILSSFPAPKILWFKDNNPQIFNKINKIFLLEDYILFKLTGNFVSERTLQSSTLYMDLESGEYWQQMLDFIGIENRMLPALKESGEYVGSYDNIPVFTGALDQIAGMIGSAVMSQGKASAMIGTTLAVTKPVRELPPWHRDLKAPCHYFNKEYKATIMWSGTAGMALQWFKDAFCENLSLTQIDKMTESIPIGSDGLLFLPYLTGSTMPVFNPNMRAVFYGIHISHTRAHFARSVMESVAFILNQFTNCEDKQIMLSGGGAKSKVWCKIFASVTGKNITTLKDKETACLGTAILALKGLGIINDIKDVKGIIRTEKDFFADKSVQKKYERVYDNFLALDKKINN